MQDIFKDSPILIKTKESVILDNEPYLTCRMKDGRWHIVQSDRDIVRAFKARDTLANHDFKNGHIETTDNYRVFKLGLNWIEEV